MITLLFKDGRPVEAHELSDWLKAVEEDPETTGDELKVARMLVHYVRTKAN